MPTQSELPRPPQAPLQAKPVEPDNSIEREKQARPASASTKTITVTRFEFAGNTLFSSEELETVLAGYLNRPVTLLDILDAGDKIADYYVAKGYMLASVNVPPQKIEGGVVRMLVSEGRIARVTAEGTDAYDAEELSRYMGDIAPGTIYRGSELNESMRIINTLPGLTARAVIRPGERYGTSDLVIKATETPVSGSMIVDNAGRENIGEFRFSTFVQLNNPGGVEDQLQLLGLVSENMLLKYGYLAYSLPVNFSGTRFEASVGHAAFEIDGSTVSGHNTSGRIGLVHPLLVSAADQLSVRGGLARTRSNADVTSSRVSGTSITVLELGSTYTHTYQNLAISQLVTTIASNFDQQTRADINDAFLTLPNGKVLSADERLRLELDLQHLQPLPASFQLLGRLDGVYSPDPLADTEQFSLGGPNSVRGYPASEVRGDAGYLASLALQKSIDAGPVRLLARAFAEGGQVFIQDADPGVDDSTSLTAVGIGGDAAFSRVSLKLDWAFPLDDRTVSDGRDDSRVFGSLAVTF
ncbi:MAG TPA: ShlB/FhaC/HecB family hemolysin secretion/activation protein [Solimonas sp.]|nr:ShlB/FhaC/HecB family hemolysin secretion/activation protein [Solimonas sp.]